MPTNGCGSVVWNKFFIDESKEFVWVLFVEEAIRQPRNGDGGRRSNYRYSSLKRQLQIVV